MNDTLTDISIEPLGCGLYAIHITFADGRQHLYISDTLNIAGSVLNEVARVHLKQS